MGSSRAGRTPTKTTSPLASAESAGERLLRLQTKLGRTEEARASLRFTIDEFCRLFRKRTFILMDSRFRRFQKALGVVIDSLEEFTPAELDEVQGFEPIPVPEPVNVDETPGCCI